SIDGSPALGCRLFPFLHRPRQVVFSHVAPDLLKRVALVGREVQFLDKHRLEFVAQERPAPDDAHRYAADEDQADRGECENEQFASHRSSWRPRKSSAIHCASRTCSSDRRSSLTASVARAASCGQVATGSSTIASCAAAFVRCYSYAAPA